jgi:uncharacterized damage-inducible protein DinB
MTTITKLLLAELEREAVGTRRALERVPEGHDDWKPHEKSMPLGHLVPLVATMLGWIAAIVEQDNLDLSSPGEFQTPQGSLNRAELLAAFDKSLERARQALSHTTDEHLETPWQLLVSGQVVQDTTRYVAIRDTVINHLAHHRGQLTVYLRLNDATVPAIYGPSADDKSFGNSGIGG